jgi:RNA polymerase sigma factor (sigma-70 family)
MLSRDDEGDLVRRWRDHGDRGALTRLCHAFSPLVISIARRHAGNGGLLDDLVQEGNIGLLEALRRFDPDRGFRLSTYARWWIEKNGPQIYPTDVSTSEPLGDDGLELNETLVDDGPGPEAEVIERLDREIRTRHMRAALAELTERESYIIRHRYLGDRPETLSELRNGFVRSSEKAVTSSSARFTVGCPRRWT